MMATPTDLEGVAFELVQGLRDAAEAFEGCRHGDQLSELVRLASALSDHAHGARSDVRLMTADRDHLARRLASFVRASSEVEQHVVPLLPHHMGQVDDPWARSALRELGVAS